ncbi:MAG: HEAT repeat domain-containing protein, partial [Planctomycetes bacterium]|nr:HEAT repeat domain-containing protein [Planctomycetota bacterium]
MTRARTLAIALPALFLALAAAARAGEEPGPTAGEKARWKNACAAFQKWSRSVDAAERAAAAKAVDDAMAPGLHLQGAKMLAGLIAEEVARGARREEDVRIEVLESAVSGLRRVRDADAVAFLLERLRDSKASWRVKFHLVEGLAAGDCPEVVVALREAAAAEDPRLRIAALEAMGKLRAHGILDAFLGVLRDPSWQVRVAALLALRKFPLADEAEKGKAAEALVAALKAVEGEGGRLKWEIVETLRAVTGDDAGFDATGWEGWLARFKRGKTGPWQRGETRPVLPSYHGIEIRSNR